MSSPADGFKSISAPLMNAYESAQALITNYVSAATKSHSAAWQGFEEISRNMHGMMQESMARTVGAAKMLSTAKTPQEVAETHTEFFRDMFDGIVATGGKLSEISLHAAKGALEPLSQHATEAMGTLMKKATKV
jgi:phasin family protein